MALNNAAKMLERKDYSINAGTTRFIAILQSSYTIATISEGERRGNVKISGNTTESIVAVKYKALIVATRELQQVG